MNFSLFLANFQFRAEVKKVTSRAENPPARAMARASSARTHHYYFSLKRVDNSILTNKGKSRVAIQILKDYARYFCRICVNLLYSILILDKDFASFKSKEETT